MSPIEMPQVAQPTVGNIPPPYLSKDALKRDLKRSADARLRAIGSPQFHLFLEDVGLNQYIEHIAVPQWLPFTSTIASSLAHASGAPLLSAYQQELFCPDSVFKNCPVFA